MTLLMPTVSAGLTDSAQEPFLFPIPFLLVLLKKGEAFAHNSLRCPPFQQPSASEAPVEYVPSVNEGRQGSFIFTFP